MPGLTKKSIEKLRQTIRKVDSIAGDETSRRFGHRYKATFPPMQLFELAEDFPRNTSYSPPYAEGYLFMSNGSSLTKDTSTVYILYDISEVLPPLPAGTKLFAIPYGLSTGFSILPFTTTAFYEGTLVSSLVPNGWANASFSDLDGTVYYIGDRQGRVTSTIPAGTTILVRFDGLNGTFVCEA